MSVLSAIGAFGSEVVIATEIFAVPSANTADFTSPKETMSRLNPGYFTCLRASLRVSEVTMG